MSIWAEIKKAINSNLNLPLNEKIDRDIEENRIGKGIVHSTKLPTGLKVDAAKLTEQNTNSFRAVALVKLNNMYYLVGTRVSGYFEFKRGSNPYSDIDALKDVGVNSTGSMMSMYNATVFVYNNAIYYTGGGYADYCKQLYKYTTESNKWTKISNVPFDIGTKCSNYEFDGLAYIYLHASKEIAIYNGSSWSKISINDSNLDTENKGHFGSFFKYHNKLYLCVSDYTRQNVYFYVKSGSSFVPTSDIPIIPFTGLTSSYGDVCCAENKVGELYAWFSKSILKLLSNNTWKVAGSTNYGTSNTQPVICNDKLTQVQYYSDRNYIRGVSIYTSYDVSGYLPKNSEIIFDNEELTSDQVVPIKNCEVIAEGRIKVLEDGSTSFRIVNDHWRKNTNLLIR